MSLISIIYGNAYPIIISDRAISDPDILENIVIPSTGKETGSPVPVVEFRVKSTIIKDILCVAFAGLVSQIEALRSYIVDYFTHRDINKQSLLILVDDISDNFEEYSSVSVLLALGGPELEDNKLMVVCLGNWLQDHSKTNLDILATGSGASEWVKHFVENEGYSQSMGDRRTDCIFRALTACIKYISLEFGSEENLLDGWGAGFDIVYYEGGKFHRYDNVTYSFLYVREDNLDAVKIVSLNHNRYEDENVLVMNYDFYGKFKFSLIPPFGVKESLSIQGITLACKSHDVITGLFIRKLNDEIVRVALLIKEWESDEKPMFIGIKSEDSFRYAFKQEYNEAVNKGLKQFMDIQ
ncbi:hypothetical protein G7074_02995 [Pedobacter sp. HDW13]|uniref:hypothetical protein n=1 Tax=Pedobacter sp. HDW13 TaxID=2714940 RepID=UPI00140BC246|nr:hypothetical protein [Pedobacter sp. HDW13]QIL38335.1 hypothetical protein G7074_02995 [Pedobacter sp. HDW13]